MAARVHPDLKTGDEVFYRTTHSRRTIKATVVRATYSPNSTTLLWLTLRDQRGHQFNVMTAWSLNRVRKVMPCEPA